jgi:hypothetical protein
VLSTHQDQLERLRDRLLEQRVLERVDILAAIGPVSTPPARLPRPTPRAVPSLVRQNLPLAATGPADEKEAA